MKLSSKTRKQLKNELNSSGVGLLSLMISTGEFTQSDIYMYQYYSPYEPFSSKKRRVQYIHYTILFILESDKQGDF